VLIDGVVDEPLERGELPIERFDDPVGALL
jgi:hypothetical protein